jgi:6-methylsalicylate decarboxylase
MPYHHIDVHHHVIPEQYWRTVIEVTGHPMIPGVDEVHWDLDTDLATMDRYDIQTAVLSVTAPGVGFVQGAAAARLARQVTEYLAELLADHPTRYGAFALLPLPDVEATLAEIDYALDTLGLDGVGLFTHYRGVYVGDPAFDRVFATLAERDAVTFLHPLVPPATGQPSFGLPPSLYEFTFDTTRAVANLLFSGTLDRHPELKLILSHAGGAVPYLAHRMTYATAIASSLASREPRDLLGSLRGLYYDTAVSANPATLSALTSLVDTSQVLFGSDYPYLPAATVAHAVDGVADFFTGTDRRDVQWNNAMALLPGVAKRNAQPS